jgi:TM2 domain-containing membrane protein YozV
MSEKQEFSQLNGAFAEKGVDIDEYVALQQELNELKKQNGTAQEEKGISRMISKFFERQDAREKVRIRKKTLLWLTFLLGWAGTHRFVLRQPGLGALYLCTCWSGFSISMSIVDWLLYVVMKPDEDGYILV